MSLVVSRWMLIVSALSARRWISPCSPQKCVTHPKCGKPTRVNNKAEKVTDENGKSHRKLIRVCKKCGAEID